MEDKIVKIIQNNAIIEEIQFSDELITLGIDSLKLVQLILEVEEELGVEVSIDKLSPKLLVTVQDIINVFMNMQKL